MRIMRQLKNMVLKEYLLENAERLRIDTSRMMIYEALSPSCDHSVLLDNKGTFHGYDINFKADITQESLRQRIRPHT